jgi:hypothetical protein
MFFPHGISLSVMHVILLHTVVVCLCPLHGDSPAGVSLGISGLWLLTDTVAQVFR